MIKKAIKASEEEANKLVLSNNNNTNNISQISNDKLVKKDENLIKEKINQITKEIEKVKLQNNQSNDIDDIFSNNKKQTTTYVKVSKPKSNVTRYTPQYKISDKDNENNKNMHLNNAESIFTEKDIKNYDIKKEDINIQEYFNKNSNYNNYYSTDYYNINNNSGLNKIKDQKVIDLSTIKHKVDTHIDETKKLDSYFTKENEKLNEEYKKLNQKSSKNIEDYKKLLINIKQDNVNQQLEQETKNSKYDVLNKKINKFY